MYQTAPSWLGLRLFRKLSKDRLGMNIVMLRQSLGSHTCRGQLVFAVACREAAM